MAMIKLTILKCKRCGHSWIPRQRRLPKTCPKCHSPYWNKPRAKPKAKAKKR